MRQATIRKPNPRTGLANQPRTRQIAVLLLFVAMVAIGLAVFPDYGLSVDEEACRFRAIVTTKYVTDTLGYPIIGDPIPKLADYSDRDHGVIFDLAAYGLERLLDLQDLRDIFILKHLLNFLVFMAGVLAFYRMATRRFANWITGAVGAIFLYLSPRIFADDFYNPKDLVFMAFFVIAMDSALAFLERPVWTRTIWCAFATALAVDTRIMGIVLVPMIVLLLLAKAVHDQSGRWLMLRQVAAYLVLTSGLIVLFWPMLWSAPVDNFLSFFSSMSKFVRWEKEILLLGQYYLSTQLPWFYVPVWLVVTTPILYSVLAGIGLAILFRQLVVIGRLRVWQQDQALQDTYVLAAFFGPLASVILLDSVLYDGWRQMYFIYPAFLMVALHGLTWLASFLRSRKKVLQLALILLVVLSCFSTGIWMFQSHPLQNVYFNVLAGQDWKSRFDLDYWGLANRGGLEYILSVDSSPVIVISTVSNSSVGQSFAIIETMDRSRLVFVQYNQLSQTDLAGGSIPVYVFNNYKQLKDQDLLDRDPEYQLFYHKQVGGETILTVYKKLPPR